MNDAPKPRRRWWPKSLAGKAGVVCLVFIAILLTAYWAAGHYSAQRLADAWKLSEEFGFSNEFEPLLGEYVAPEKNMATPLDEAATIAATFQTNALAKAKTTDADEIPNDPDYIAAFDGLLRDAKYEAALAEADRRQEYYSPVVVTRPLFNIMLTYLQTRRDLVRAEQSIAKVLESQGKRDEAVQRLLRVSRLTRRWQDREPFLIGALVNIAIRSAAIADLNRILRAGGPLSAVTHEAIEKEMAEAENIHEILARIGQTEKIAAVSDYATYPPLDYVALFPPLANNDKAYMIHYLHQFMRTAKLPPNEAKAKLDAMENELKKIVGDPIRRLLHIGTGLLLPAVIQARTAFDRFLAQARCLRVVNAMAKRGDWKADPATLGLSKECLIDPFEGKSLRIKQTPKGPIVYSVGPDLKDGGGNIDMKAGIKDVGLGPLMKKEKK